MNTIKQWILNRQFVIDSFNVQIDKARQEERITAFTAANRDILDTMEDDLDTKAQELANTKLANLLSAVDMTKIVTIDKQHGFVYLGGVKMEESALANFSQEAEIISSSALWQLLIETPKELAQRAMFVDGDNIDSMKKGRAILYCLSSQKNIIELFRNYVPKRE